MDGMPTRGAADREDEVALTRSTRGGAIADADGRGTALEAWYDDVECTEVALLLGT